VLKEKATFDYLLVDRAFRNVKWITHES